MHQPETESRRLVDWTLARYARQPARGRLGPALIAVLLVVVIGLIDGVTGTEVSISVFYLIPVAFTVVRIGRGVGTIVALASVGVRLFGDFIASNEESPPSWVWWNAAASLVFFLVVIWILHAHITLHRRLEQRVADRTRALREAVEARERIERELRDVGARERAAVGRDLHDDLGQHLVGTAFAAKVLGERLAPVDAGAARDAGAIVQLLEESIAKTRSLAHGLLLGNIAPGDLPNELTELAARGTRSGAHCRFHVAGDPVVEDAPAAVQLFRIAQEAMRNALQHGRPTRVDITLRGDDRELVLLIEDDGIGLPGADARGQGIGLRIMAHRAAVIGGELTIAPAVDRTGTLVTCRVPRRAPETIPSS